ncbi:MAG TPA: class I SAM-dependent methyltransferase [Ktedonobacteraceae bacterium]|jgi:SAM-dependent methyltransferase|nr:class I SAM-dependent methyltransferase [Ktedonobacteraceae bacterium]
MSAEITSSSSLIQLTPIVTRSSSSLPGLVDQTLLADTTMVERTVKTAHSVYEHLIALWAPAIIEAAHDLSVFATLAKEPMDVVRLAQVLQSDLRGMRVLLDALYALGFVQRSYAGDGTQLYSISQELQSCLLPGGIFSLVGKMIYDRRLAWPAWQNFAQAVRTGSADQAGHYGQNQISDSDYEYLVNGINFWAPPSITELCRGLQELEWDTSKAASVLDVGCGTGLYCQLLLQKFQHWTALGLDCERIIPLAISQSERLGVESQFSSRVCDFWQDEWGSNFDLILFANIFHLQTRESARTLVTMASRALAPGGLICIVDHILDDERNAQTSQDRFALLFAASMLATGGGDAYSLGDYDRWFAEADLRRVCVLDTPMHRLLLATHAS